MQRLPFYDNRRSCPDTKKFRAFTLIELLSAIAVIAVLLSVLIAASSRIVKQAGLATCSNNLRQCGQAMLLYAANDSKGRFPVQERTAVSYALNPAVTTPNWAGATSEYLEIYDIHQKNHALFCPAAERADIDHHPICYAMNQYLAGLPTPLLEQPSKIVLLRHTNRTNDAKLVTSDNAGLSYADTEEGEYHYLFADGHVDLLTPSLPEENWQP
ncbi:MAG: type II secretion system protein [Puniceicoccales bacterium]